MIEDEEEDEEGDEEEEEVEDCEEDCVGEDEDEEGGGETERTHDPNPGTPLFFSSLGPTLFFAWGTKRKEVEGQTEQHAEEEREVGDVEGERQGEQAAEEEPERKRAVSEEDDVAPQVVGEARPEAGRPSLPIWVSGASFSLPSPG